MEPSWLQQTHPLKPQTPGRIHGGDRPAQGFSTGGGQGLAQLGQQRARNGPQPELEWLQPHFWYWPNWAS